MNLDFANVEHHVHELERLAGAGSPAEVALSFVISSLGGMVGGGSGGGGVHVFCIFVQAREKSRKERGGKAVREGRREEGSILLEGVLEGGHQARDILGSNVLVHICPLCHGLHDGMAFCSNLNSGTDRHAQLDDIGKGLDHGGGLD
jgi:hypothetical protein